MDPSPQGHQELESAMAENALLNPKPMSLAASAGSVPGREVQELWLTLARNPFHSLVLIPASDGGAEVVAALATSLADMGRRLRDGMVSFLVVGDLHDPATASLVASQLAGGRAASPEAQVIVALPPVITDPLGVAIAHAADLVVLCVEMGRTRTQDVQGSLDRIGRDRVSGAILLL